MKKFFAQAYIWFLLILLYAPLVFIGIFSFTESRVMGNWTGFSTKLYSNLFSGMMQGDSALMAAVKNTLLIALIAAAISTLLGTIAAIGIFNLKGRKKAGIQFLNNIPMINPDIITGVSLFLLFIFLGFSQGYTTVVLAHITFCTPYVVLNVMPKLAQMNPNTYEAALDLGATPGQVFRKVTLPLSMPGITSGIMMVFMPTVSTFAISEFLTNNKIKLFGTIIQENINSSMWNYGAALALIMLVIIGITTLFNDEDEAGKVEGGLI